jgi:hypothetical protein
MRTLVAALIATAGIMGTVKLIADSATPVVPASVQTASTVEQPFDTRRGSRQGIQTIRARGIGTSTDWNRRGMRDSNAGDETSVSWTAGDWTRRGMRDV